MVCPKSADDGIGLIVTVDCIASRPSVDCVSSTIAFDRVIVNTTVTGAVDGVITGAPIDYLTLLNSSLDAVTSRSPIDERRIRYFVRSRGQEVEIVGVRIATAMDGDRHPLCGAVYGRDRECIGQRVADIERIHQDVGV